MLIMVNHSVQVKVGFVTSKTGIMFITMRGEAASADTEAT
jgi:hypothetical protein